jgi:hypothetical protein
MQARKGSNTGKELHKGRLRKQREARYDKKAGKT